MNEISAYDGKVTIISGDVETEISSIMALLSLGLVQGDQITIQVAGKDEEDEAERLVALFEQKFDFPGRESG